jgi:ATP-dependent DNA helicase MPH1
MKLKPDLLEAKHWVYPINHPKRDYQYNIVRNCLFDNTLVALPTGLGKTLIAGIVMLNCMLFPLLNYFYLLLMDLDYRWYPEGKVIFVAPTKPLVAQQVNACLETCGIPGRDSVELTGEVPKVQRVKHVRIIILSTLDWNRF